MNVFEAIRENGITARQAAEYCGIKINRSGMAVCPFHEDKNPSMKIDRRYYCFGCGEKGDAIDFVAKFYGLGKKDAAMQIASEFGISFDDNKGRKPPPKRKRKLSPEQRFEKAERKCFRVFSDYLCCLRQWEEQYAPHKAEEEWHPLFCEALEKKDYIEYLLDILLYAPLSERVELVADFSRLGRDYLQTGYYTDMYFPSKRVRYIAISDGIDTSTGYNEMAPFKNLFNDFYARDISKKIHSTLTKKARAGIYHSTVPPFGYKKSPADSHMLLRDEETAPYVIKMFELSASGRGPAAIANYLRAEKIPIPAYWHHVRGERAWQGYKGEGDASNYRWFDTTVRSILQHEVYIGNLVAQRQTHIFKVGKSFVRPKEEWVIVEDVFEPIVERKLWERVQESFANPTRSRKRTGQASIFSGMVFCDTCNRRISFVPERAEKIYVGSCQEYHKIGRQGCTSHRIYEQDLHDAVLKDIREWAKLALKDEKAVLDKVMEHENRNKADTGAVIEKKFSLEKRLGEVEKVIAKLYEDYALGKAGADEIDLLLPKYRKEQGELKEQLALFQEESNEQRETAQNAEKWVALIRKYSDLQELTAGIIRELITKIYVGDVRKVNGEKVQSIEIHYRFIGSLPDGAGK